MQKNVHGALELKSVTAENISPNPSNPHRLEPHSQAIPRQSTPTQTLPHPHEIKPHPSPNYSLFILRDFVKFWYMTVCSAFVLLHSAISASVVETYRLYSYSPYGNSSPSTDSLDLVEFGIQAVLIQATTMSR